MYMYMQVASLCVYVCISLSIIYVYVMYVCVWCLHTHLSSIYHIFISVNFSLFYLSGEHVVRH